MGLAMILLPLVPGLIQAVTQIVKAIQNHADTPDVAKAQLDEITAQLDDVAAKVSAVQV